MRSMLRAALTAMLLSAATLGSQAHAQRSPSALTSCVLVLPAPVRVQIRSSLVLKLDAKVVADWHNDKTPIDGQIEVGKMLNPNMGLFGKALFGLGGDRFFDWGVAAGVRFTF